MDSQRPIPKWMYEGKSWDNGWGGERTTPAAESGPGSGVACEALCPQGLHRQQLGLCLPQTANETVFPSVSISGAGGVVVPGASGSTFGQGSHRGP